MNNDELVKDVRRKLVRMAEAVLAATYQTPGGLTKTKTGKERQIQEARLQAATEIAYLVTGAHTPHQEYMLAMETAKAEQS